MHKDIFFESSLKLELYVIGYKSKGECILVLLKADDKAAFSGLIDCFQDDEGNEAVRLLKESNRQHFDFVCWTHPHDDHTIGMDSIVKEYCDKDTYFWMPCLGSADTSPFSQEVQSTYKSLFKEIKQKKRIKMHINSVSNGMTLESFLCRDINSIKKYRFLIRSFAPSGEILTSNMVKNIQTAGNQFSIGLYINIGEFGIMLAGDVENRTFKIIPDFDIEFPIDYVKIPHHASSSSVDLLTRLRALGVSAPSIASTTVFDSNGLPDPLVLNLYKKWSPENSVYSSGQMDRSKNEYRYGIIHTVFDILQKNDIPIETVLTGNAVLV